MDRQAVTRDPAGGGTASGGGGTASGEGIRAEIERLGREWGTWYVFVYWGGAQEPWSAGRIGDSNCEITAATSGDLKKAVRADHEARTS